MEITVKENCCIITPLSPKISERETLRLSEELDNYCGHKTGIDLTYVQDCTFDFIQKIREYRDISLFNIPSDIFAILTSMDLDKSIKLFVSEMDFLNDKHRLLNRKFRLV